MNEYIAELIGTMLLVLLGDGVVANVLLKGTKGNNSGWIVISLGWGLAVFVGVAVAGPVSGAHINPARDLPPRIMHSILPMKHKGKSDWRYSWIPVIGPVFGATIAAVLFILHSKLFM